VFNSKKKLSSQPNVMVLTEEEVICKVSGHLTHDTNAARLPCAHPVTLTFLQAAAEAKAAILKDNLKATDIFISGIEVRDSSVYLSSEYSRDGLYSPTQETGQDGRVLYLKSGEFENFYIEHFEGQWQVKDEMDVGSSVCFAFVRGGCALEECCSRRWNVVDGEGIVGQPDVEIVTGQQAKSKASSNIILAP
jgi:hypothetical protein